MSQSLGVRRYPEIDLIKAVGILVVIGIHSLRWVGHQVPAEVWIGQLTRFAVPGFLAASGFLYAASSGSAISTTAGRLRRILVPYLVASAGAEAYWFLQGSGPQSGSLLRDLALAASFGPYYYVFVIACLVVVTPVFSRLPRPLLLLIFAGFGLNQGLTILSDAWVATGPPTGFLSLWTLRSPELWWHFFLLGWVARVFYEPIERWIIPRRRVLVAGLVAGVALLAALPLGSDSQVIDRFLPWLNIWLILALLFVAVCGREDVPVFLRWLSDATYTIYLAHLFFVLPVKDWFPQPPGRLDWLALGLPWLAGVVGSVGLIMLARRVLGDRSRPWIGA